MNKTAPALSNSHSRCEPRCATLRKSFKIKAFLKIWAFGAGSQAETVAEVRRLGNGERKLALLQRHGLVMPDGLSLVNLQETEEWSVYWRRSK